MKSNRAKLIKKEELISEIYRKKDCCQIFYITGENGTGKSRLLREIADKNKAYKNVLAMPCGMMDRFLFGDNRKNDVNYLYLGSRTASNAIHLSDYNKTVTLWIVENLHNHKGKITESLGEMGFAAILKLKPLVTKKQKENNSRFFSNKISESERYDEDQKKDAITTTLKFLKKTQEDIDRSVEDISTNLEEINPSEVDCKKIAQHIKKGLGLRVEFLKHTETIQPSDLSPGQISKLRINLHLRQHIDEDTLVLIDEPDTALHLKWQHQVPDELREAAKGLNKVCFVLATHSPAITTNAKEESDFIFEIQSNGLLRKVENNANFEREAYFSFGYISDDSRPLLEVCIEWINNIRNAHDASIAIEKFKQLQKEMPNEVGSNWQAIENAIKIASELHESLKNERAP